MTTTQAVEMSVTVNNSPIQDYVHPDDQTQPTFEMTLGSNLSQSINYWLDHVPSFPLLRTLLNKRLF